MSQNLEKYLEGQYTSWIVYVLKLYGGEDLPTWYKNKYSIES